MPSRQKLIFALVVLFIALVTGAGALWLTRSGGPIGSGEALVGGPFTLTNQDGKRVTDQDFRGKYMLIFFGFTYCPDVCPSELQVMSAALDELGFEFCGFLVEPELRLEFEKSFGTNSGLSLAAWSKFEAAHPHAFGQMYHFAARKPRSGA